MRHLLLSLLLLLSLSSEALADRGRLNRFGTLTVDKIEADPSLPISIGGSTVATFSSTGLAFSSGTLSMPGGGQILGGNGTVALPSFASSGDLNTGVYFPIADQLGFVQGGTEAFRITSSALEALTGYVIQSRPGSTSVPSFGNGANSDTGVYFPTDAVGISVNAANVATFDSGGLAMISGTAAAPSFTFSGDDDTGVYRIGANSLGFTTGGSFRAQVTSVGVATTGEFRNITTGGGIVLRSPDGTYSVCTVDNSDVLSCTAE